MRTLVIIDIQKKYRESFSESYLNKVKEFLKENADKFEKIVCIMENNSPLIGDYIPKEIEDKLTLYPVFKCYDKSYSMGKIKNSKIFKINKEGQLITSIEIPEGDFYIREGKGFFVGNKKGSNINIDYMNEALYYLLNLLRFDDIYLIGGGLNNCVKKTQNYLKFLNINSKVIEDLCYSIGVVSNPCMENKFQVFIKNNQNE